MAKTISHAKTLYEKNDLDDPIKVMRLLAGPLLTRDCKNLPKGVNEVILLSVIKQIRDIERCNEEVNALHREAKRESREMRSEDGVDDDNDDTGIGGSDDEDSDMGEKIMDDNAWGLVELAMKNEIVQMKDANAKELELPTPESSKIARYNPNAHFRFESGLAKAEVEPFLDSLLYCKLRSRPPSWTEDSAANEQLPFEFKLYNNSGFDVDGDLIAMCGDKCHNEIRSEKNFVGCMMVPYPTNLDQSKTLSDLRDCHDSNDPLDMNTVKTIYNDKKGSMVRRLHC